MVTQSGAIDATLLIPPFNFYAETAGFSNLGLTIDYTPDHLPILGPAITPEGAPIAGVTIASAGAPASRPLI